MLEELFLFSLFFFLSNALERGAERCVIVSKAKAALAPCPCAHCCRLHGDSTGTGQWPGRVLGAGMGSASPPQQAEPALDPRDLLCR